MKEETKLLIWVWIGTLLLFFGSLVGLLLKIDHVYLQREIVEFAFICGLMAMVLLIFITVTVYPIKNKKC